MADERLRLVAEVTDQFTGPLGKLETTLRRTAQTGTQVGKDLKKDFDAFHGTLGKTTATLQGMAPTLSALGAGGLVAGLGLGSITAALRSFSTGTQQLSIMSKETGLAVDQLRAFGSLGERFGVSADTMQGGVKRFSDEMTQLRKRYGDAYRSLQGMNLGDLVEKLVAAPNMKAALDTAMDALSNIGDPVKRRKVAEQLFGGDQIAAVAGQLPGRVSEVLAEIERRQGQTTDAQVKAAQRFEESLSHLRENMDGLRTSALTPLLEEMNRLISVFNAPEGMTAFKTQLDEIGKFARGTVQEFEAIVRVWGQIKGMIGADGPAATEGDGMGRAVTGARRALGLGGLSEKETLEDKQKFLKRRVEMLDERPSAPDYQRKRDRMTEELKRVADELEKLRSQGGATAQPSSFGGTTGGGGPLIQKASFGGGYGGGGPGLGGFGGPLPTLGGGYGGLTRGLGGRQRGEASTDVGDDDGRQVSTPRGTGRGNWRAARTGQMMDYAMDQLRREGVPESALRQAAAHLVGQATMESGLDPNASHDGRTGYGIYGARDPSPGRGRKTAMLTWLSKNGYAPNSAEGQMRYMTHEAMSGQFRQTKRILMGQGSGNLDHDTNLITQEFEGPRVINHRAGAVRNALRAGRDIPADASVSLPEQSVSGDEAPWYKRPRSGVPGQMSRLRDDEVYSPASGGRMGDAMLRRRFGDDMRGGLSGTQHQIKNGKLDISLSGFPGGTRARASMDDLFKEVNVSKSRQMDTTSL